MAVSYFARGRTAKCAGSRPEHIVARHVAFAAWGLTIIVPGLAKLRLRILLDVSCPVPRGVTTGRMKAFLTLLAVMFVTVPRASLPILAVLKSHFVAALAVSHAGTWVTDVWWDRPYLWIQCGGPPGRWIVGTPSRLSRASCATHPRTVA
jgi:hypothetical protein